MKTTIDMAREAGWTNYDSQDERFKAFEALVRADERALAAPTVQEPKPACRHSEDGCPNRQSCRDAQHCLYTTPPAQPTPVQEPVAWLRDPKHYPAEDEILPHVTWKQERLNTIPLYTTLPAAQRQWVGLTDEERTEIRRDHYARTLPLMDAVEAKLKEKNA
jgi:hypothetical protein